MVDDLIYVLDYSGYPVKQMCQWVTSRAGGGMDTKDGTKGVRDDSRIKRRDPQLEVVVSRRSDLRIRRADCV